MLRILFFFALCALSAAEERTFVVLRLTMAEGSHRTVVYSKSEIEQQMVHSQVSIPRIFRLCSAGSLTFTSRGVFEITVPGSYSTYTSSSDLRNAGLREFDRVHGLRPEAYADHVIAIVPGPNPFNFVGNGGMNHWISTLSNEWSLDVMVYIHELGHNLDLGHSESSVKQGGDLSSMMSATGWEPRRDRPMKCFNAPDNNRLGWFDHRKVVINPVSTPTTLVRLAAFSEWESGGSDPILATIGKYSMQYNRATGINRDTEDLENEVAIGYFEPTTKQTFISEGLAPNGFTFTVSNFENSGKTLRVQACKQITGTPGVMEVAVTLDKSGSPCSHASSSGPVEWRIRRIPTTTRWTLRELEFHSNTACTSKIPLNGHPIEYFNTGKMPQLFDGALTDVRFLQKEGLQTWVGYKFTTAPNVKCVKVFGTRCSLVVEAKTNGAWVEVAADNIPRYAGQVVIAIPALQGGEEKGAEEAQAGSSWLGVSITLGAVVVGMVVVALLRHKRAPAVQEPLL